MKYVLVQNGVVVQVQYTFETGFIAAPDDVYAGYLYSDGVFSPPPPPPIEPYQVDMERDRRLGIGFMFNGKLIDSSDSSRASITEFATLAFMAKLNGAATGSYRWGNPDNDFTWITADNSLMPLDANGMVSLSIAASSNKSNLVLSARALKAMSTIPQDYTSDKWWTA